MQTFPLVEGKMPLLRKRADGYVDAGRLHAGRVVYCSNEENADDHEARPRGRRGTTLVTPPRSGDRAFASEPTPHSR